MIILLYHRIIDLPVDPQLLCVRPENFAEQLDAIRRVATIVPLQDALTANHQGSASPRVAITFDDGYADNAETALPILREFAAPATVFVTARDDGASREFWWDELESLLLADTQDRWNVMQPPLHPRHVEYLNYFNQMRNLPAAEQQHTLDELSLALGRPRDVRPTQRVMTDDQLRELAASRLVDIGAHTLSHPVLSAMSEDVQRREIQESKARLESIISAPVRTFSYPYGTRKDYTPATVACVREAGFSLACSNFSGTVTAPSYPFQLPRHLVRDWPVVEFTERFTERLHA